LSEWIALTKWLDSLWRRANARNISLSISVWWSIYIINSVDTPNFQNRWAEESSLKQNLMTTRKKVQQIAKETLRMTFSLSKLSQNAIRQKKNSTFDIQISTHIYHDQLTCFFPHYLQGIKLCQFPVLVYVLKLEKPVKRKNEPINSWNGNRNFGLVEIGFPVLKLYWNNNNIMFVTVAAN